MVYLYSEILCTNTNMKFKSKILTKRRLEYESNISTNIKFKNQENMSRDRNQSSSCPVMGGQCCELLGKLFHDRSVLGWGLQSIKEISGVENILHTDLVNTNNFSSKSEFQISLCTFSSILSHIEAIEEEYTDEMLWERRHTIFYQNFLPIRLY